MLYIWEEIVPLTLGTLRKIFLTELWSRLWAKVNSRLSHGHNQTVDHDDPSWLFDVYTVVRKGTQKLLQSSVQKNVEYSLGATLEVMYQYQTTESSSIDEQET